MKRVLSIAAVIVLVFALSAPAFAVEAVPSVTYADTTITVDPDTPITDSQGREIALEENVELVVSTAVVSQEEEATLPGKIDDVVQSAIESGDVPEGTTASAVEVVNVDFVQTNEDGTTTVVSEDYFEEVGASITVAFARDDITKEVIAVLYWNANTNEWDEAEFTANEDGSTITATFLHFCTVAFVLADKDIEPAPGGETGGQTEGTAPVGGKDPSKSPQTGYNALAWTVAAAVLFLSAGFCFVSARKKTNA